MIHLVVDGNAFLYSSHFGKSSASVTYPAIRGFLSKLLDLVEYFKTPYSVLVLWDGKAHFRYNLDPAYKSNRATELQKIARTALSIERPLVQRLLFQLGIPQLTEDCLEADDLAYWITQPAMLAQLGDTVHLSTVDSDWTQLVAHPQVVWKDILRVGKLVTLENFSSSMGFDNARHYLQCKMLTGDSADAIEGLAGVGPKTALKMIDHYGGFSQVCQALLDESMPVPKEFQKLACFKSAEARQVAHKRLLTNEKLMDLSLAPKPEFAWIRPFIAPKPSAVDSFLLDKVGFAIPNMQLLAKSFDFQTSVQRCELFVSYLKTLKDSHA